MHLVAAYLRRMHDSGLWHRDMVTSNLLLTGVPGNRQVSLVDLNRAWRIPYMPMVLRAMDLARMGWWERLPQFVPSIASDGFQPRVCCGWCTCMGTGAPGAGICAGR